MYAPAGIARLGIGCWLVCLLAAAPARPCTIFAADDGALVLAGNNEDYLAGDFDTGIWYVPARGDDHGFAVVGYTTWEGQRTFSAQGGVNDQGLFLDGNAAPYLEARTNTAGRRATGWDLFAEPLRRCTTVQQALELYAEFDLTGIIERAKIFIADRHGNAAILEGDVTSHKSGDVLISTNFYESHPELGGHPCWRYDAVEQRLGQGAPLSLELAAEAAAAASHDGTYYTNVHDLNANTFRLYYRHDFDRPLQIDLAAELAGSGGVVPMADLFGPAVADERGRVVFHPPHVSLPGRLAVLLRDAGPNADPDAREQVEVALESPGGDAETLTLFEIRPDAGVFAGALAAEFGPAAAGDGRLQAAAGDRLTVRYHDADDGSGAAAETLSQALVYCDLDQDGHDAQACGGQDCLDLRADFNPDAVEFCDAQDDDCDQLTDEDCSACLPAAEPDITPTVGDYNPLACDRCFSGDFDEQHYRDEEPYRLWADAYRFEARAGQTVISSIHRPAPDGILWQYWYSLSDEVLATDSGYGALVHTFDRPGTYVLVLGLRRVDPTVQANDYRLELDCAAGDQPPQDGGPDGGDAAADADDGGQTVDGGSDGAGTGDDKDADGCDAGIPDADDGDGAVAGSGCGCRGQGGRRGVASGSSGLFGLFALLSALLALAPRPVPSRRPESSRRKGGPRPG